MLASLLPCENSLIWATVHNVMFTTPFTKQQVLEMVQELRREQGMREVVYPSLIQRGKLQTRQAEERMERIRRAIWLLESLIKHYALDGRILGATDLQVTTQGRDLEQP